MDFIVACYTRTGGAGLYRVRREGDELRIVAEDRSLSSPSFALRSRDGRRLWAASELSDAPEQELLAVYDISGGRFRLLSTCSLEGHCPCYLAADMEEGELFGANYDAGSFSVFALEGDRAVLRQIVRHTGSGPNRERQEAPHVHQTMPDGWRGLLHVVDLGTDAVVSYGKGPDGSYEERFRTRFPGGSGPRHLEWGADGETAYLCFEMANCVSVLRWNGAGFTTLQTLSTLPEGFDGFSACAAIHRVGDCLYVSNRGDHDSIVRFTIREEGLLSLEEIIPVSVHFPREFLVLEDGAIVVAGEKADRVILLAPEEGGWREAGEVAISGASCLVHCGR